MRIARFLLPLFAVGLSFGQSVPDVHRIAQQVDQHYNQIRSLRTSFTESYEGMGMHRTERGTLTLAKPGRMRWEYSEPAGKLFLIDGRTAWFYAKGDPQVQRLAASKLDDLRSPLRFLLGHTQLEKELVNLAVRPAAAHQWLLTGQPAGKQQRVRHLRLTVGEDGAIAQLEMEEMDGAVTRFVFSNQQPNASLPADSFQFHVPAGVPVVDALPPV